MKPTRLSLLIAVAMFAGAGCEAGELFVKQGAERLTETAVEGGLKQGIQRGSGQDVDVDFNKQGVSFTDPKTGRSFAFGEQVTIPATFPKDIPVYPKATPTSATMTGETSGLLLVSTDERKTVRDWYATEAIAAGWKKDGVFETADNIVMAFSRAENGGTAKMTVTLPPRTVDGKTNVIIARNGVKR